MLNQVYKYLLVKKFGVRRISTILHTLSIVLGHKCWILISFKILQLSWGSTIAALFDLTSFLVYNLAKEVLGWNKVFFIPRKISLSVPEPLHVQLKPQFLYFIECELHILTYVTHNHVQVISSALHRMYIVHTYSILHVHCTYTMYK